MRVNRTIIIVSLAAMVTVSAPAAAFLGLGGKDDPVDLFTRAVNHHRHPAMVFRSGILSRTNHGWALGGTMLTPIADSPCSLQGLQPGMRAIALGYFRDGMFMTHYICGEDPARTHRRGLLSERHISARPEPVHRAPK